MSWATQLQHAFSSKVRQKGAHYAEDDSVQLMTSNSRVVLAEVMGSVGHDYAVLLKREDSRTLLSYCSCPHFAEGNFCKHLWAVILNCQSHKLPATMSGSGHLQIIPEYEEFIDESDLDDDDDDFGVKPGKSSLRAKPEPWHKQLEELTDQPSKPNLDDIIANRQLRVFYVVEVTECHDAGVLRVNFYQQVTKKDGSWGKIKPLHVQNSMLETLPPQDADLLGLVVGHQLDSSSYGWGYNGFSTYTRVGVSKATRELLLPKMAATGRLGWIMGSPQSAEEAQPLSWDDGPEWLFSLHAEADNPQKQWRVTGKLHRTLPDGTTEQLPLEAPVLLLKDGLVMTQDRLARLDTNCDFRWVVLLRQQGEVAVPFADRERLLTALAESPAIQHVELPAEVAPATVQGSPTGHLLIHPEHKQTRHNAWRRSPPNLLYADAHFQYGQQLVPLDSTVRGVFDAPSNQFLLRDGAAEWELREHLRTQRISPRVQRYDERDLPGTLQFVPHRLPAIVDALSQQGWLVEAEGLKIRTAREFSFSVTTGVDWFDLESSIDFGQATASLPELLAAVQRGEHYVTLDDGSRGMLPLEWLERIGPLADLASVAEGDRLRFQPSQAMLLDAMLAEQQGAISLKVDLQFAKLRKRLESFAGVEPAKPPRGFRGELRPYQQQGLGWLKFLQELSLGGCLADDMGLGKTVQVLALLLARRQRRRKQGEPGTSLVVAPKSLVVNWQLEAERFAPTLKVLDYTGTERKEHEDSLEDYHLVVTTYGTLRRDIEKLRHKPFDYVVLDEAQAIKNSTSQSAKACRLLNARHRLTLTGTPIENRLDELWSQFEFLNPGMLGRSSVLEKLSRQATDKQADNQEQALDYPAERALPRSSCDVLSNRYSSDLPEKNEQTLYCDLLPKDRKQYNDLRSYYRRLTAQTD